MVWLKRGLIRGGWVTVLAGAMVVACQAPDEFYRDAGSLNGTGGDAPITGGSTGSGGVHGSGGSTGSGGVIATGGLTGAGGTHATGGVTGSGGTTAAGGSTGTGGTHATGGVTGSGGITASGGVTGAAGMAATGGTTGAGGRASGGTTGAGGTKATGGTTGAAGSTGSAGSTGAAGASGTGPCAGLCSNPTSIKPAVNSGDLGTAATCDEVVGNVTHVVFGNFVLPRTFSINGAAVTYSSSNGGATVTLPAPVNGGWCMQAGAGNNSYAYFTTY